MKLPAHRAGLPGDEETNDYKVGFPPRPCLWQEGGASSRLARDQFHLKEKAASVNHCPWRKTGHLSRIVLSAIRLKDFAPLWGEKCDGLKPALRVRFPLAAEVFQIRSEKRSSQYPH